MKTLLALLTAAGIAGLASAASPAPTAGAELARTSASASASVALGLGDFDAYVQRVMQDWRVPGAAIAIVQDGRVILSKGYGLRDVKNNLPMTPRTLFPIASITKSFTVATLAALASAGKLDWDKPVREYLPDFRLSDDVLTARVTPRDLVTHRTGLPRHDSTWYRSDLSREELYARLRYLEPNRDLRREFQYNNLMFMTAGYMAGKLTGGAWEGAVQKRIFDPLGMTSSSFDLGAVIKTSPDVAHAYCKDDSEIAHEIPAYTGDKALGPAGAIVSNLPDMTRYLLMYLNQGKHGDTQIIAPEELREMISPQMVIHSTDLDPEIGYLNYGMGLFVTTYRGHKFVYHSGSLDGFSLNMTFLPEDDIGCVVLLNMDHSALREVLAYNINDRLLGLKQIDWNKRKLDRYYAFKKASADAREKNYVPRRENTSFSHLIEEYYGEYADPAYGTFLIERGAKSDELKITYHTMQTRAQHWHYDVWRVPHNPLDLMGDTEIMFQTDWEGNVASLTSPMELGVKDIVFKRLPDRRMRERAFLEPLAGTYQVGDYKIVVSLRPDNVLVATFPTQKIFEMEPVRGNSFAAKEENGTTIDFKRDAAGKVTELSLTEQGTSSVFKRAQ
jgi:CubicO group peptidase (beta-lactamase class C family)